MSFKWFFVVQHQAKINDVLLTMGGSLVPTHQHMHNGRHLIIQKIYLPSESFSPLSGGSVKPDEMEINLQSFIDVADDNNDDDVQINQNAD